MFTKGFTGIAIVIYPDNSRLFLRFLSADFSLSQGINVYLPSYGGSEKRRIVSPMTGDISGRISTILVENMALNLYELAYDVPELTVQLYFYDGTYRQFEGVKVENITFDSKAGEMVQLSIDVLCLTESTENTDGNYHDLDVRTFRQATQKLVAWSKTSMEGVYVGDITAFSYSIKNNLVTIKTAKSLLPRAINPGIQEVSGNIVLGNVIDPPRDNLQDNLIFEDYTTFMIDDLELTHRIAAHWSYRTPLNPEIVLTTLDWVRVDEMTS